jgi:predicted Zn-dependent protease
MRKQHLIATVLPPIALLAALAVAGCVTNPATGRSQLNFLSQEEEIRIGEQAMQEALPAYGGEIGNSAIKAYISEVGQRIAAEVEPAYADLPWQFAAINTEQVNAFALPGGKVFISKGLLREMDSEAQLAAVLAHEVAHVTAEHHDLAMQRQLAIAGLAVAGNVAAQQMDDQRVTVATQALVTGAGLFALRYNRAQEHESDRLGLRYMTRAGYNPKGMLEVMKTLDSLAGDTRQPEWTSTHPDPGNRADTIARLIDDEYATAADSPDDTVGRSRYQEEVLDNLGPPPAPAGG